MRSRLCIFLFFLFITNTSSAKSAVLDKQVIEASNRVIVNVFREIQAKKAEYKELENFGEENLRQSPDGLYVLMYEYYGLGEITKEKSFSFYIRALPLIKEKTKNVNDNEMRFDYPILGVSIVGQQFRILKTKQIDVFPILEEQQQILIDKQQESLPFRLSINTSKDIFQENEDIEFIVSLKNTTNYILKIQNLSAKTLKFTVDDKFWGTTAIESEDLYGADYRLLKPGEVVSKKFKGKGLGNSKEFNVLCKYSMAYRGINPRAMLRIRVLRPIAPMTL